MEIKTKPEEIWNEYKQDVSYKDTLYERGLCSVVEKNEDFYNGIQWRGVNNMPDLPKPVINVLKRPVSYFIANIVSDDIGVNLEMLDGEETVGEKALMGTISRNFDDIMESANIRRLNRMMLRDAAVDGDGCIHYYFDVESASIKAELLENTNVHFGNNAMADKEKQPYIIISLRRMVEEVREEAKAAGSANWQEIEPDGEAQDKDREGENYTTYDRVTVLRKYYRKNGYVWFCDVTQNCVVQAPTNSGYKRYPLVWYSWERRKNSYHGMAVITPLIENQLAVNKLFAMAVRHVSVMAFPTRIVNENLLRGKITNAVGAVIKVGGDPQQAVGAVQGGADMSAQVLQIIDTTINYTRETMGASDAALGNIKPDNTSAIIATQNATALPLQLQKMEFYDAVEESCRIWLEMMAAKYGVRTIKVMQADEETGEEITVKTEFDYSMLADANVKLKVDIGAATYWSELMQVQTLDSLFSNGIITDAVLYLESLPDGYVKNRAEILRKLKEQQKAIQAQQVTVPQDVETLPQQAGVPEMLQQMQA